MLEAGVERRGGGKPEHTAPAMVWGLVMGCGRLTIGCVVVDHVLTRRVARRTVLAVVVAHRESALL